MTDNNIDLTVMLLAYNEAENLAVLIPQLNEKLAEMRISYEIMIVDGGSRDGTAEIGKRLGASVVIQEKPGYGEAFRIAFREARGEYVLNIDADCSHSPRFITSLWERRSPHRLVIASRYLPSGTSKTSAFRQVLSVILNKVYSVFLGLPFKDLSSGYRLYYARDVKDMSGDLEADNFDILLEALIKLYKSGTEVVEVPFCYEPRHHGHSHVRMFNFAVSYIKTLVRTQKWKRNYNIKGIK